jgi:glycosyltransferase involved in cell wall biosynthesis
MQIAVIGNFLPRQCGIATFTGNFIDSILSCCPGDNEPHTITGIAIDDPESRYQYGEQVKYSIRRQQQEDYLQAAAFINNSGSAVCVLQHEFGIFGGESGVFILTLLQHIRIPVITIFHTVLKKPSYHEKEIMKKVGSHSSKVVVMSNLATSFLQKIYGIPSRKIQLIHHGVPDFSHHPATHSLKKQFPGKTILCTFGLLGRSKGIETVINALPAIMKHYDNFVYVILGKTHPNVKKHCGEEYRDYLKQLADAKKVGGNIVFIDEFVTEQQLKEYLMDVDIYITPYLNESQITSGTLAYAIGAGTCIVSTPFWHATELLANGRGSFFGFGDCNALAATLCSLLGNPAEREAIRKKAFAYGKGMYWKHTGRQYLELLETVRHQIPEKKKRLSEICLHRIPAFDMEHIVRLTDSTGILEHASFSTASFKEGYCLDDNSRALLLVAAAYRQGYNRKVLKLADIYLRYIKLMQKEDGSFNNDYTYDRKIIDVHVSEDAFGRTIWAMGYLIELGINDAYTQFAKDTFFRAAPHFSGLQSLRGMSNTIIGLCYFLKRYPDNEYVIHVLNILAGRIAAAFNKKSTAGWCWFEDVLTYDNAIIPLAMWHAAQITKNDEILTIAKKTTAFLDSVIMPGNKLSLIGNQDWFRKDAGRDPFGQQPVDAMAMVLLHQQAFAVTGNKKHYNKMLLSYSWFLGNNDLYIPLYDEETKGCCDGIEQYAVNRNQGAESAISYQLAYLSVKEMVIAVKAKGNKTLERYKKITGSMRAVTPEITASIAV